MTKEEVNCQGLPNGSESCSAVRVFGVGVAKADPPTQCSHIPASTENTAEHRKAPGRLAIKIILKN